MDLTEQQTKLLAVRQMQRGMRWRLEVAKEGSKAMEPDEIGIAYLFAEAQTLTGRHAPFIHLQIMEGNHV